MIEKIKEWAGVIALVAILLTWLIPSPTDFGAGTRFPNGISADTTAPSAPGEIRGADLVLTDDLDIAGDVQVGSSGTAITRLNGGKCNIWDESPTVAASSTSIVSCQAGTLTLSALTGVAVLDDVFVQPSTTTFNGLPVSGGVFVVGASASTTAGYIDVTVYNGTGAAYTWTAAATTSWNYWAVDR